MFLNLSSIETLDLSATNVSTLQSGALAGLSKLRQVLLPTVLEELEGHALPAESLLSFDTSSLDLRPTSLRVLRTNALVGVTQRYNAFLPAALQDIEADAFNGTIIGSSPVEIIRLFD